ncbi:diguanylate cyclase (GGDEF)-like protein/putative nucleotidyltransferase with HDIG domain [Salirhabdus euzebyi]|uniref:Diguanylate cyclase (GGDEF)-like protein/putative nucleotidyltransferase with HDIG domain n=1 Tax=Salirhabdus euzebyi TaxID=394506 RepID=A0A841PY88_9BACI|nr:diguanylate cyclase [Salirhabdus euzebyi]MBB6451851.1 diguanylate cyclase (GGDEF)-like protein/putative nucleotidyltransferase with HDIG domain [Salirhabdus euzebyi]
MNLSLNNKFKIYLLVTALVGCGLFFVQGDFLFHLSRNEWIVLFVLVCAVVLLNEYMIKLPPKGNSLSMDSAIYVAVIFVFGLETSLYVLAASSVVFSLYHRKIVWWKHLFNFSIYSLMITGAYYTFIYLGGEVGSFNVNNISPYLLTMGSYFLINIVLIGLYFMLYTTENLFKGIIKDALSSYFITLSLAFILAVLLDTYPLFGLVIFSTVTILLSLVFRHYFNLYEDVSNKANIDDLTGLSNHGYFKEVLSSYFKDETKQPLSLCMLDIDDFKKYNDYHGHLKGDELLKYIGQLLKDGCEEKNYLVARYGGEEFVILMPNTKKEDAFLFINNLRKTMNDSYFDGVDILPQGCLSFSGGVIEHEKPIYTTSELLGKADQAMYYAKAQGKNMIYLFNENDEIQHMLDVKKETELLEQKLSIFLYKDIYTYKHSKRVYQYAISFADRLDLTEREKKLLIMGALIHDIGKLEIPRDIINKKGKLDPHEWEIIKKHVTWGKEIISINKEWEDLIPLVELHHERYDGKGYPYGLAGKSIPKLARILCIIDSFDAMTTERPYQKTKSFDEGIEELLLCADKQFDGQFIQPFIRMIKEEYPLRVNQQPKGTLVNLEVRKGS